MGKLLGNACYVVVWGCFFAANLRCSKLHVWTDGAVLPGRNHCSLCTNSSEDTRNGPYFHRLKFTGRMATVPSRQVPLSGHHRRHSRTGGMRELTEAWPETADQRTDRTKVDIATARRPVLQHSEGKNPRKISESRRDALDRMFVLFVFVNTRCTARSSFRSCGPVLQNKTAFPHRWRETEGAWFFFRVPGCPNATPVKR